MKYLLTKRSVPTKKLASVVGLITSCLCALGKNFVKFLIRSVNRDLGAKVDMYGWFSFVRLSHEAKKDLRWFRDNLSSLNSCDIDFSLSVGKFAILPTAAIVV